MRHALEVNGVGIVRTPTGIGVMVVPKRYPGPLNVQVEYDGRRIKDEWLDPHELYRDYFGPAVDHLRCVVRVRESERVLAELSLPDEEYPLPFMVRQGEQRHVTESSVSVPPALTITDGLGAVWTLGFVAATKEQSPEGEFAFEVLRDGVTTHEIASRIEMRNNTVRVFTRHGWKKWNPDGYFF